MHAAPEQALSRCTNPRALLLARLHGLSMQVMLSMQVTAAQGRDAEGARTVLAIQPGACRRAQEELRACMRQGWPSATKASGRACKAKERLRGRHAPLVLGPALAMLRMPGPVCLSLKFSSAKVGPYTDSPPVPSPAVKSPP
jgi:hypothetical protein